MRRPGTVFFAILAILIVLLGLGTSWAMAAPVSPGDILVAEEGGGTIHHYSASGADLGALSVGNISTLRRRSPPSWAPPP